MTLITALMQAAAAVVATGGSGVARAATVLTFPVSVGAAPGPTPEGVAG